MKLTIQYYGICVKHPETKNREYTSPYYKNYNTYPCNYNGSDVMQLYLSIPFEIYEKKRLRRMSGNGIKNVDFQSGWHLIDYINKQMQSNILWNSFK